jgi:ribose transport system permease protein
MEDNRIKLHESKSLSAFKAYLKAQAIPIGVLLVMVIIGTILSPTFLTKLNLQNLFIQQASTMVASLGMFVAILSAGIDLSIGSMMAVSSVFCASMLVSTNNIFISILFAILICAALGTVNGIIVAKLRIAPFIVTLGMMEFARGIAYWYTNSAPVSWKTAGCAKAFAFIGKGRVFGSIPTLAVVMLACIIIVWFMMKKTAVGRIIYAIGGNEEAVKLSGINVSRWKIFPYTFSAICAAIAGVLLTARLGVGAPTNGADLANDCIAAVVIGGTSFTGGKGNVGGVIIGVFILGIINNLLDLMNVSSYPQMMLKGAIIVIAVVFSTIKDKNA